ncbi:hypothetical protein QBC32DRAFT_365809 [Pseudoneurospora amorphoporcata]|uniref:Uncharacterized protein n=1 Tax=Pseudoneurospora amorphoporcata TaxID=241081 RepID=A0AAN6NK99_9PEZI|nr:hypothetical protein QBC32DRAFT_365809 [Pseudoneurospora amorphoporcata]
MSANSGPAAKQRFITSFEHLHQIEEEERQTALQGANAAKCVDFPTTQEGIFALIDKLISAMDNVVGVVDNLDVENPDENGDVKFIRHMPRERKERMAWEWLSKLRDVQLGIRNPDVYTPEFPDFMSRFNAFLSFVRSSKSGVTDLFAASFADRYICNPVAELDTKVSNNYTNSLKPYHNEVKGARQNGRTVSENNNIAEFRDAAGNLIKTLEKPRKRPLSDFLADELPAQVKKPKRVRRGRTATGSSTASVATPATPGNGGSPGQNIVYNPLPAIQEEKELPDPSNFLQGSIDPSLENYGHEHNNVYDYL